MKLTILLTLVSTLAFSPWISAADHREAPILLVAKFQIMAANGNTFDVRIRYSENESGGEAVAVYSSPNRERIRDVMHECSLVMDKGITSLHCLNPHFTTWDSIDFSFMAASPVFTDNQPEVFRIVSDVRQVMRFQNPIRQPDERTRPN